MEMRCQKCGTSVNADQAFCSKCGAVVGMSDDAQKSGGGEDEWNMAATMVGKKMPLPESSRPTVVRQALPPDNPRPAPQPQPQPTYTPSQQPVSTPQQPERSSNTILLVVIGLVAVLLLGALLALLLYLNWQG